MNEKDYRDELKVLYDKAVVQSQLGLAMELLDKRRAAENCVCAKVEMPNALDTATQAIKKQNN